MLPLSIWRRRSRGDLLLLLLLLHEIVGLFHRSDRNVVRLAGGPPSKIGPGAHDRPPRRPLQKPRIHEHEGRHTEQIREIAAALAV